MRQPSGPGSATVGVTRLAESEVSPSCRRRQARREGPERPPATQRRGPAAQAWPSLGHPTRWLLRARGKGNGGFAGTWLRPPLGKLAGGRWSRAAPPVSTGSLRDLAPVGAGREPPLSLPAAHAFGRDPRGCGSSRSCARQQTGIAPLGGEWGRGRDRRWKLPHDDEQGTEEVSDWFRQSAPYIPAPVGMTEPPPWSSWRTSPASAKVPAVTVRLYGTRTYRCPRSRQMVQRFHTPQSFRWSRLLRAVDTAGRRPLKRGCSRQAEVAVTAAAALTWDTIKVMGR